MQASPLISTDLLSHPVPVPPVDLNPCSTCQGTAWEFVPGKGVRPCSQCQTKKNTAQTCQDTRIPRRYQHCTLKNYQLVGAVNTSSYVSQATTLRVAQTLAETYPKEQKGLLLLGPCGVGKTHLVVATALALQAKGALIRFYDFRELLKLIQESYNAEDRTSEWKVLAPVRNAEVLILDEIGAARPTDWALDTMTQIINHRYNHCQLTLFTSNYADTPTPEHPQSLTERVGPRIRSRLREMCRTLELCGMDYRAKKEREA